MELIKFLSRAVNREYEKEKIFQRILKSWEIRKKYNFTWNNLNADKKMLSNFA